MAATAAILIDCTTLMLKMVNARGKDTKKAESIKQKAKSYCSGWTKSVFIYRCNSFLLSAFCFTLKIW
jgi:hypothetical protein